MQFHIIQNFRMISVIRQQLRIAVKVSNNFY